VASVSACLPMRSERVIKRFPRSVGGRSRQVGFLRALRAALTAVSTSVAEAA